MLTLWLVAIPLAMAVVLFVLRRIPIVAAPLSASTLMAVAILASTQNVGVPLTFMGRMLDLPPLNATALAYCSALVALLLIYGYRVDQGPFSYPVTLVSMALFAASLIVQNVTLATLCFLGAGVLAVMLIPGELEGSAITGMRTLVILTLAAPLLLLAAWAMDSRAVGIDAATFSRLSVVMLALGSGVVLAVVPMNAWLPAVFRKGPALSAVLLSVVLSTAALLQLDTVLRYTMWAAGKQIFADLALNAGAATAIVAGVVAITQQSLGGALAYAAVADMGVALIGFGLGNPESTSAAALHLAYRGVSIVAISMALGIFRGTLDGEEIAHLKGAFHRAPLSTVGMLIAGFSLAGLPLTAGFTTRLAVLRSLGAMRVGWVIALGLTGLGPAWVFVRCAIAAFRPGEEGAEKRESFVPALLTLALGLCLLLLGIAPGLLTFLPTRWLESLPAALIPVMNG